MKNWVAEGIVSDVNDFSAQHRFKNEWTLIVISKYQGVGRERLIFFC